MNSFQINDPSLESQWRAIILFGKNSATYKFAFAKALLELVDKETTRLSLDDLAEPFSKFMMEHLTDSKKQGTAASSKFLTACQQAIAEEISQEELINMTLKYGFNNVVDAFQNVNGDVIPDPFYIKDYTRKSKDIIITDELLKLKESFHFQNFEQEVEARWNLVETAWNYKLNPALLEVKYDEEKSLFFLESNIMIRVNITSVRDALNGYQKGKCFYSFQDISVISGSANLCEVDHFLPHANKILHNDAQANINGVWNLVLADAAVNNQKRARIPKIEFLERLYKRNEFYIESKHPLAETIINQTGKTALKRQQFLQKQYQIALDSAIHTWEPDPSIVKPATF